MILCTDDVSSSHPFMLECKNIFIIQIFGAEKYFLRNMNDTGIQSIVKLVTWACVYLVESVLFISLKNWTNWSAIK
jgi:hypothetical protein